MLPFDLKDYRPSTAETDAEFLLALLGAAFFGWAAIYLLAWMAA